MGTGGAWDHSRIYTSEASEKRAKGKGVLQKARIEQCRFATSRLVRQNQLSQTAIAHAAVKSIYSVDLEITPQICGAITPQTCGAITPQICGAITPQICGATTPQTCGAIHALSTFRAEGRNGRCPP